VHPRKRFTLPALIVLAALSPAEAGPPTHLWSQRFGNTHDDVGWGVATDTSGSVFITGLFTSDSFSPVDFGGGPLLSCFDDIFVAKYDPNGVYQWSKRLGACGVDFAYDIIVDASGNVLVTGSVIGTVNFGGGPTAGGYLDDVFVAKYDPDGSHLWSARFANPGNEYAYGVAVDVSGATFLTGTFNGTADFGGGPFVTAGKRDIFLAKYDAGGAHEWSHRFGSTLEDWSRGVAVDAAGSVYVVGTFRGSVDFGGGILTSAGLADVFLAKYDSHGVHQWSRRFGDIANDEGNSIELDASGNVVITGAFVYTVDFGGGPLTSSMYSDDIFLAKFDPAGGHLWSRSLGGASPDLGYDLDVDASGDVLLTGIFSGAADFGGGFIAGAGQNDIFVAKYSPSGSHLWSAGFGGPGSEEGRSIAADGVGGVAVTGGLYGTGVDFGGGAFSSAGWGDIFLARYESENPVSVPVAAVGPTLVALGQNVPNPFSSRTTIEYVAAGPGVVALGIYDIAGALVAKLDPGVQGRGNYQVEWDGRDAWGQPVPSGVYFYRVEGTAGPSRRMTLIR
jgi:hypothetical protein